MTVNFEALLSEHDQLARLAGRVRRLVADPVVDVAGARAALDRFVDALAAHLAHEQTDVYPALIGGRDRAAADAASTAAREFVGVSIEWSCFLARWSDAEIAADWPGFAAASEAMFARIEAHIRRENELLYPLALAGSHIRLRA
jgi:iron-sulfur cluster repair protein YtfE (RIC family)